MTGSDRKRDLLREERSRAVQPAWRRLPPAIGGDELSRWRGTIVAPVAVTGASGFIGSHLVEALCALGARPRLLLRDPARLAPGLVGRVEVVEGGLGDRDALRRLTAGAATVLHVAGVVRAASEAEFDRGNRQGTADLVAALATVAPAARLVAVSSLAAAGPSRTIAGVGPGEEPRPVSAYGRSKLAAEREALRHAGPVCVIRPPAVYGPRDIDILQFFRLAARGLVPIPAGERYVTVVFVADVVRAVLQAAGGAGDGRTVHIGEPSPRALRDLVGAIAAAGGCRARIVAVPGIVVRALGRGGDLLHRLGFRKIAMTSDKARELLARHWTADTAGSLAALGLDGTTDFAAGAGATWEWYRAAGWVPHAKIRRL